MSDKADFYSFLTTAPAFRKINFQFMTYLIYPEGYTRDVAGCVDSGQIEINRRFSDVGMTGTGASYFPVSDSYSISKGFDLSRPTGQILIAHESTHALQDFQKLGKVPVPDAEAIAYVAEAIFSLASGYPILLDPATGMPDPIRVAAANAAASVLAGNYTISQGLIGAVRSAVSSSSHYGRKASSFVDCDGIEEKGIGAFIKFIGARMHD